MSETITLDVAHREAVRGIVKDSSILCTITSAPDVYVHVITKEDTAELHQGDGTIIPKMTRTRFHVFRSNTGDEPFSATVTVTDLPASAPARSDVLMSAFSLVKHKPDGIKPSKTKRASKKTAKKSPRTAKRSKTSKSSSGSRR